MPALKNINFYAKQGEKVAVIGGTGSGKSTLVKMLLGFYPISSGDICLGEKSYKEFGGEYFRPVYP